MPCPSKTVPSSVSFSALWPDRGTNFDRQTGLNGVTQVMSLDPRALLLGGCSTLNTAAWRNTASVCLLSGVLEPPATILATSFLSVRHEPESSAAPSARARTSPCRRCSWRHCLCQRGLVSQVLAHDGAHAKGRLGQRWPRMRRLSRRKWVGQNSRVAAGRVGAPTRLPRWLDRHQLAGKAGAKNCQEEGSRQQPRHPRRSLDRGTDQSQRRW